MAVPWMAIAAIELFSHVQQQPWWRGSIEQQLTSIESAAFTWLGSDAIYREKIQKGDAIAGYKVTSGFGRRTPPRTANGRTGSSNHKAIDLATPVGTQLYMPGSEGGTIECKNDPSGWGKYALVNPAGIPYTFRLAHLQHCQESQDWPGAIFATTGNSGNSSGPHLDFAMLQDGVEVHPTKGYLLWFLRGKPPTSDGGGILDGGNYDGKQFTREQMAIATEIIQASHAVGATSEREQVAVLMTAMQESSLGQNTCCDADSNGILQQRPSMGWPGGDIRTQVKAFFNGAGTNHGWWDVDRGGEIGSTIQAVQKSAHPEEYQKWQDAATKMVRTMN